MANFFKKNAKLLLIAYAVILFATLVSGLFYMTSLANVHVYYSVNKDTSEVSFSYDDEITSTGLSNRDLFKYFGTKIDNLPEGLGYTTDDNNYGVDSTYFVDQGYAKTVYDFQMAMSQYNTQIIVYSIIGLLCFCVMMIFSNHSRKVYYKSNLFAGIAMPVAVTIYTVIMLVQNFALMGTFNQNIDLFRTVSVLQDPKITPAAKSLLSRDYQRILDKSVGFGDSCFWVQSIFYVVVIAYSLFLIVYTIYRYKESTKRRNEIIERAVQNND